ncbi:TetR/AcrR family transcriptional regulator [Pseudonocardia kunmingensis]|uniref:TetR family transcriptional regulator n=1 Tax=Pseudonocardia kunmingensis TaxID=630975 RepID=A0A543DJC2_9PSEU|nr:TetR/AcrR family transcriptional regulator [Pseudonocardia kunmingensis]TQM09430.1 TetR family transcriptional regulator [Pseudonocardia kunmingensis]
MARRTRAEMQEHNRARVLAAARQEFAERGFRDAKIDVIAESAELTRGAVYSNFPGKRALFFAVLADLAERAPVGQADGVAPTVRAALGAFARARLARLPLAAEVDGLDRLGADLVSEVLADERTREPYAQLTELTAVLLGLALEGLEPGARRVRVARAALTALHGAGQLAVVAPGFADPFDLAAACAQLADLDLDDTWAPPHLPYVARARPTAGPWTPPAATDALRGAPADLTADGVVAVLGLHRVAAVEEAVRAAPRDATVTAVVVSSEPAELLPLARLVVAELRRDLRAAVPAAAWPRLRVVVDPTGAVAAAAGERAVSDGTEAAVRVAGGRIVARADGRGACHAAASTREP